MRNQFVSRIDWELGFFFRDQSSRAICSPLRACRWSSRGTSRDSATPLRRSAGAVTASGRSRASRRPLLHRRAGPQAPSLASRSIARSLPRATLTVCAPYFPALRQLAGRPCFVTPRRHRRRWRSPPRPTSRGGSSRPTGRPHPRMHMHMMVDENGSDTDGYCRYIYR
jgi:hypothetical protein